MRQKFETPEQTRIEREIATYLSTSLRMQFVKNSEEFASIDYNVFQYGTFRGRAEIKRRYFPVGKYPDVILSMKKWHAFQCCHDHDGSRSIFVVRFNDNVHGIYRFNPQDAQRFWIEERGGRTVQTRDAQDIEPVIHIPMGSFRDLNGNFFC
jgi:hypothetical protein